MRKPFWMMSALLLFAALGTLSAHADTIDLVTVSGQWETPCPAPYCTAPGDTWTVSFEVDSTPTPIAYTSGVSFESSVTDFSYSINGTLLASIAESEMVWYEPGAVLAQGYLESLSSPDGLFEFVTSQLYSGPEADPTISLGTFGVSANLIDGNHASPILNDNIVISAVPEPGTAGLMLIGIGGLMAFLAIRRKHLPPYHSQAT